MGLGKRFPLQLNIGELEKIFEDEENKDLLIEIARDRVIKEVRESSKHSELRDAIAAGKRSRTELKAIVTEQANALKKIAKSEEKKEGKAPAGLSGGAANGQAHAAAGRKEAVTGDWDKLSQRQQEQYSSRLRSALSAGLPKEEAEKEAMRSALSIPK